MGRLMSTYSSFASLDLGLEVASPYGHAAASFACATPSGVEKSRVIPAVWHFPFRGEKKRNTN